ncbi:hypothetical protein IGI04_007832 [Brassica rapa subsp. trilocularis]|uniref:Phytanoyl-CoA dioxygenase n=1 Tax=Brassica rapa subsp. trilocularis TaxID=1813537 RepID=A0ABQ7NKV7_BRACM|nr:hypothetical protein IGI04_007832 [Brassica rapa subsp. trilocularis]
MGIAGSLTPDQLEFYNSQGYLVIESFASEDEIGALRKRMNELLTQSDCSVSSVFSTKNQKKTTDNYFFESAEKISFFFEEKAFGDDGELKQPKELSINKVGHALHELDPLYKEFTYSSKVSSLVSSLGYRRPVVMQAMYIFKVTLFLFTSFVAANFNARNCDSHYNMQINLALEEKLFRTKIILLSTRIHRAVLVSGWL